MQQLERLYMCNVSTLSIMSNRKPRHYSARKSNSDGADYTLTCVYVSTVSMLLIAALLLRVWLAVAVGYGLGSAPGQDPGPRALHH